MAGAAAAAVSCWSVAALQASCVVWLGRCPDAVVGILHGL